MDVGSRPDVSEANFPGTHFPGRKAFAFPEDPLSVKILRTRILKRVSSDNLVGSFA